jgi:O-methyltransferase
MALDPPPFSSRLARYLAIVLFYAPPELVRFLHPRVGADYGVGFLEKLGLIRAAYRNSSRPGSFSFVLEHLALMRGVLLVPATCAGAVAEFGCFKGFSTSSLSLVCKRTGRRLLVFDSFEGLPDPGAPLEHLADGTTITYRVGEFAAGLEEVRANVSRYGAIEVCDFIQGFFEDTLPARPETERYCLVFEDADLTSSVRTVIRWAWPKLATGGVFYTHEARDLEVTKIFFDDNFWKATIGRDAPGLVGSGLGLSFTPIGSCLGFVVKR